MDAQVTPVVIVGDCRREPWIDRLVDALPNPHVRLDRSQQGALSTHIRALRFAQAVGVRCIIMEDDAIPVVDFLPRAQAWFDRFPDDLISFYLGGGRPVRWQAMVDSKIRHADADGQDAITLSTLLHGVCYSIPPADIPRVLENLRDPQHQAADYAIGAAYGRPVIYPVESLVQHRDGPVVERHPDGQARTERRVARRLAGPLMYEGDP